MTRIEWDELVSAKDYQNAVCRQRLLDWLHHELRAITAAKEETQNSHTFNYYLGAENVVNRLLRDIPSM